MMEREESPRDATMQNPVTNPCRIRFQALRRRHPPAQHHSLPSVRTLPFARLQEAPHAFDPQLL